MNLSTQLKSAILCIFVLLVLAIGCSGTGGSEGNPLVPSDDWSGRRAMDFQTGTQTIFGAQNFVAAEVDLASVVWGMGLESTVCGDIVEFDDDTSWVASVGIEQTGVPLVPSLPVVRFLMNDGDDASFSEKFYLTLEPVEPYYVCRFPRIDCTYLGLGLTEVTVVFRYGENSTVWDTWVENWDLQLHRMYFRYVVGTGWTLTPAPLTTAITSDEMSDGVGEDEDTGQTHPDIAYDHDTGDLYCAWTELDGGTPGEDVDVKYQRINSSGTATSKYSLGNDGTMLGGWFVSLDTGIVEIPGENTERYVGFAYTGEFVNGYGEEPGGFHPLVGYWTIEGGLTIDTNHEPQFLIINDYEDYEPTPELYYSAGLVRIDIPSNDNADDHGAAIVFVQDTLDEEPDGRYHVFGLDSLETFGFVWLSDPGTEEFYEEVLPSVAVHTSGDSASVTYFATDGEDEWEVWATHWEFVGNVIAEEPTAVDNAASGTWSILDMIQYDWGTGSSLVTAGNGLYWAAWSDDLGGSQPTRIYGSMGIADD